jgi:hypothetical protein
VRTPHHLATPASQRNASIHHPASRSELFHSGLPPTATTMASPEPPPTPETLTTIPDDLVLLILARVLCKDDRASMSLVCKAWRDMIAGLSAWTERPPPPFPWLLLPSRFHNDPRFRAVCILSGCCVHPHHNHLTILPPGTRFIGSYEGAWIFVHYGMMRAHWLLNLRTGEARALPSLFVRCDDHQYANDMFVLAATLSSPPENPHCIGAAIVVAWRDPARLRRFLVFWRMGRALASEMVLDRPANHRGVYQVEDVVHHGGAFNVLVNHGDHILVCVEAAGPVYPEAWNRWMNTELLLFRPTERIYDQFSIRGRYIVESRGELLKVLRFRPRNQPTSSKFTVFRATKRPQMPDADFPVAQYPWAWSELDTLDGRILFVGYGCSRSYDAVLYPGFKAGIYFLDDGKFYDEGVFFRNHRIRPQPCKDNGKWSEGSVQRCFPTAGPSDHSPPVWLLP